MISRHESLVESGGLIDNTLSAHIERIDLLLQRYLYQQRLVVADEFKSFLLPEEIVIQRLRYPLGMPHWMQSVDKIDYDCLKLLTVRFELTPFERDTLLLGLLSEYDARYQLLFAVLNNDKKKNFPTFSLALSLFSNSSLEKQACQTRLLLLAPLLHHRLLIPEKNVSKSWEQTAFVTHTSVWHFLCARRISSPSYTACAEWQKPSENRWYPQKLAADLTTLLITNTQQAYPLILLQGRADSSREQVVTNIMAQYHSETLLLDFEQWPDNVTENEIDRLLDVVRDIRMFGACLLLKNLAVLLDRKKYLYRILKERLYQPGVKAIVLIELNDHLSLFSMHRAIKIVMPEYNYSDKLVLLSTYLPHMSHIEIENFCHRYSFTPVSLPAILDEAEYYRRLRDENNSIAKCDLYKAFNYRTQQHFGKLAQRIIPQCALCDVIVSEELKKQLSEILTAIRYKYRFPKKRIKIGSANGINVLFHGDSGTGKTMAAEAIAGELGVDLIKIDLSTVVDKYIGETEKNLARIFDLAEQDAGVLFFDEADALFGKRSETKDAKDRYANIEISYLLQRLENYSGLVILATNNRNNLDTAFIRRFAFITHFTYPDATLRRQMWQSAWLEDIKLSLDIKFDLIAQRYELTAAHINNIAALSIVLAAGEGIDIISLRHIEHAIKRELKKLGIVTF